MENTCAVGLPFYKDNAHNKALSKYLDYLKGFLFFNIKRPICILHPCLFDCEVNVYFSKNRGKIFIRIFYITHKC